MTSLDTLLENYWILREEDPEKYESIIGDITKEEQEFIKQKLGYKLIINPYLIKLEKIPGVPKAWMGINEFQSKLEYVFLCMILIFLETKSSKEQFVLSGLIEFIENNTLNVQMGEMTIDFTSFKQRQAMVRVLKFIRNLGFIRLYDGDENRFVENISNDALYEITGISKFFVRNFTSNIMECNSYMDIYKQEQLGLEQDKGIERRKRVYRRLFIENAVYREDDEEQDFAYIRNYKNILTKDCDMFFDSSLEVHKDVVYVVLSDEKNYKNVFPGNKAISDITLFVNRKLRELVEKNKLKLMNDDKVEVSSIEWNEILNNVRTQYGNGFSKEYRNLSEADFVEEVSNYMQEFEFIKVNSENKCIQIMPITWKIIGKYPNDFEEI